MQETHTSIAVASGRPHRVLAIDGCPANEVESIGLISELTIDLRPSAQAETADAAQQHTLRGISRHVGGSVRFQEKSSDHKDVRTWVVELREDGCYATPQATF